jgi:L-alanine-DL-glutamate epimerase-like enolase superfamily enzyme
VRLESHCLDLCLTHAWKIARTASTNTLSVVQAQLTDSDGTVGQGEAAPVSRYNESVNSVEEFLRKVNASKLSFKDIPQSMGYLDQLSPHDMSAKCAINMALHDGAARLMNQPVYDFLRLGFREKQHVTSFTIGIDKPAVISQKVLAAETFPILKMKVGVPGDIANLQALRKIAPQKLVRVDANEGWTTKEQALKMIDLFATDAHIQFVEQPMPASTSVKDWVWLKQRSPLPIFADESFHLAQDAERVAECFHGVNVKLVKCGGLSAAFAALQAARKAGLKTMLGCMIETSVLISAAAHLAELCDYLDLDGNLLITNDPYVGVTAENGILSFAGAPEKYGLRIKAKP